jgi:ribA/ribD-fused uncharacterized protein
MISEFQNEYRFLSNFWPVPGGVTLDGSKVRFPTVEHAYQAAKVKDLNAWHQVAKMKSPGEAKRWGRTVVLRTDWEHVRLPTMLSLVCQKFAIDPLRTQLLETGNQELIEGNRWNDTFWGVCHGVGSNHLGKILMQVRRELRD